MTDTTEFKNYMSELYEILNEIELIKKHYDNFESIMTDIEKNTIEDQLFSLRTKRNNIESILIDITN
jgi:hypothetical protein